MLCKIIAVARTCRIYFRRVCHSWIPTWRDSAQVHSNIFDVLHQIMRRRVSLSRRRVCLLFSLGYMEREKCTMVTIVCRAPRQTHFALAESCGGYVWDSVTRFLEHLPSFFVPRLWDADWWNHTARALILFSEAARRDLLPYQFTHLCLARASEHGSQPPINRRPPSCVPNDGTL